MEQKIKELRVRIDGLAQLTKGLEPDTLCGESDCKDCPYINSQQIDKAVDSLYLAKAWLGKMLGALGTESPYSKDGARKTVEDIEPTADRKEPLTWENWFVPADKMDNHIKKVDWLRQEIKKSIVDFGSIWLAEYGDFGGFYYSIVFQNLSEARFWLGFELERIREEETNK